MRNKHQSDHQKLRRLEKAHGRTVAERWRRQMSVRSSKMSTLREGIGENLVELKTTVKYKNGKTQIYNNSTISLEDIKEEDFEVITRARYNTTIVAGTSCTQVEKKVEGTMVTLYETNPNAANSLNSNYMLLINMILLSTAIETFTYSRG